MLWPILGYSAFGFLLGYTTGLTEGEIAQYFLGILIAFLGGSIGYYINKDGDKKLLGALLFFFSVCCVLGLSVGILTKENRLLSFNDNKNTQLIKSDAYLKNSVSKEKIVAYLQKISTGEYKKDGKDLKQNIREIKKLLMEME